MGYDHTDDEIENSDEAEPWPLTRTEMHAMGRGVAKGIIVAEVVTDDDGHTYPGWRVPDKMKKDALRAIRDVMEFSRHERNKLAASKLLLGMVRADVAAEAKRTDHATVIPVVLPQGVPAAILELVNAKQLRLE